MENKDLWQALLPYLDRHEIRFFRVKGHVNPDSSSTNMDQLYEKFIEWNGTGFTPAQFDYITRMNIRADELANQWKKEREAIQEE